MKPTVAGIVSLLGIAAVAACTRTPLDPLEGDEANDGTGGLLTGSGGQAGSSNSGGRASGGTGGRGGAGGFTVSGGTAAGGVVSLGGRGGTTSGTQTGGIIPTGGAKGGAGGIVRGGAGGVLFGGAGGAVRGGAGGIVRGGAGGTVFGGAGGRGDGGAVVTGGVTGRDGGSDARDSGRGGTTGTGGTVATGGAGGACPGPESNEEMIDDLNDGDRFIPRVNGRLGSWATMGDGTPGGVMSPQPGSPFTPTDTGEPCRKYAAYVNGTGFTDGGASFWFGLGAPYDASKYTGISFWAKSDNGTSTGLRVDFPDKDTQPEGGICESSVAGPTQCWSHYGMRISLTPGWSKRTIRFKDLSQDPWGLQATAFDPASLYEVRFEIPANATFSIWIDDVAFTM